MLTGANDARKPASTSSAGGIGQACKSDLALSFYDARLMCVIESKVEKWYNILMEIDEFDPYFGGKIDTLKDAYLSRDIDLEELKSEFASLDDEMTDALEDDFLTSEQYAALREEMEDVLALDVEALEEE